MCRPANGETQTTIYNAFIRECIRNLKAYGNTYAYFKYQIDDIKKAFPHDEIVIKSINNYYILELIKKGGK